MTRTLLILGGTAEAGELARRMTSAHGETLRVISSLAGRIEATGNQRRNWGSRIPGEVRIGGFGGQQGLEDYLKQQEVDWLIDATHPFAANISRNARRACEAQKVERIVLDRPPWRKHPGDQWVELPDMTAVAKSLPWLGRRVFLTLGEGGLKAFARLRQPDHPKSWFLVRLISSPEGPLPLGTEGKDYEVILGRGPFSLDEERALIERHHINVLVAKMSGGAATEAKIIAAREARIPVLFLSRPPPEPGPRLERMEDILAWLDMRVKQFDETAIGRR
jgi:precorrin-6A/cobalt-precorrin-6A reductase